MILFLGAYHKLVIKDSQPVETFDNYTIKRKGILIQMKLLQKYLDKIQKLLVLQYLMEFYIGQTLSEKIMSAYYHYFNEQHVKIIESILQSPINLRTIISALTNRNGDFAHFMLECLYVAEKKQIINKGILGAFNKCNADKFLVRKIYMTEFNESKPTDLTLFHPKLNEEQAKMLNMTLHLFSMTLNRVNPVSMENFFSEIGDQRSSTALLTVLVKLYCQSKFKSLAVSAGIILDLLLSNFKFLKTLGSFDRHTFLREKSHFIKRVVSICLELQLLNKSTAFFKVVDLFLRFEFDEFVVFLSQKIDLLSVFQETYRFQNSSKLESCVFFSLLNRMIQFELISEKNLPQLNVILSLFKDFEGRKQRRNNMLTSSLLVFKKTYETKFGTDYSNSIS